MDTGVMDTGGMDTEFSKSSCPEPGSRLPGCSQSRIAGMFPAPLLSGVIPVDGIPGSPLGCSWIPGLLIPADPGQSWPIPADPGRSRHPEGPWDPGSRIPHLGPSPDLPCRGS